MVGMSDLLAEQSGNRAQEQNLARSSVPAAHQAEGGLSVAATSPSASAAASPSSGAITTAATTPATAAVTTTTAVTATPAAATALSTSSSPSAASAVTKASAAAVPNPGADLGDTAAPMPARTMISFPPKVKNLAKAQAAPASVTSSGSTNGSGTANSSSSANSSRSTNSSGTANVKSTMGRLGSSPLPSVYGSSVTSPHQQDQDYVLHQGIGGGTRKIRAWLYDSVIAHKANASLERAGVNVKEKSYYAISDSATFHAKDYPREQIAAQAAAVAASYSAALGPQTEPASKAAPSSSAGAETSVASSTTSDAGADSAARAAGAAGDAAVMAAADAVTEAAVRGAAEARGSASATAATGGATGGATSTAATATSEVSGATDPTKEQGVVRTRFKFWRSLQFRIMLIFTLVSLVSTACMGVMSYTRVYKTTNEFVDEELSQISLVAINYRMIIPRRWEAPRTGHERILRLRTHNGEFVVEYGTRTPEEANTYAAGGSGTAGAAAGTPGANGAGIDVNMTPSIFDLHKFKYDIIIAPLYGRPGDALYIPPGVADGFYTVLVADQRVRAFISTNAAGQRFVVARPLSSIATITKQALISSIWQFIAINLIFIPILIISVRLMFRTLNKIALSLYQRNEYDLSPVVSQDHKGFVPSELDGFTGALNRLFSRVDEGIQSKRRFIADAAHEMRTPLTALSLQAESLEKEELSPRARVKVERLREGISRERELMTDLLTLAREQNKTELHLETIDIMDLYIKLIDEQDVIAERKGIDLGVEGKVNYQIVSDRMRLTRIMSNILSNAIKYTQNGGKVDLMATPLEDGSLKLTIQDNGPGIPEDCLKHIFEPFYRVHGDRSNIQGTGLGLAIVKASCESIGATIDYANVSPHGLVATVLLRPLSPKSSALPGSTPERSAMPGSMPGSMPGTTPDATPASSTIAGAAIAAAANSSPSSSVPHK